MVTTIYQTAVLGRAQHSPYSSQGESESDAGNSSDESARSQRRRARLQRSSSSSRSAGAEAASSRDALHNAERNLLRHIGLFESANEEGRDQSGSPSASPRREQRRQQHRQHRQRAHKGIWTKPNAIFATRASVAFIRYPFYTAVVYAQFSGREDPPQFPLRSQSIKLLCRGLPFGALYQWLDGHRLTVVGTVISAIFPSEITSPKVMLANVAAHYCVYVLLYGLFRQSVVAKLPANSASGIYETSYSSLSSAVWSAIGWMRSCLLIRRPRSSVLCLYVRDILGNVSQGILSFYFTNAFTSYGMVSVYRSLAHMRKAARRLLGDLLGKIGLTAFKVPQKSPGDNSLLSLMLTELPLQDGGTAALGSGQARARQGQGQVRNVGRRGGIVGMPVTEAVAEPLDAESSSDGDNSNQVEVVFEEIESREASVQPSGDTEGSLDTAAALQASDPLPLQPLSRPRLRLASRELTDREILAQGDYLVYTRAVSQVLGELITKLVFYPVDSVLVRLMADEAGLTSAGYTGFFNCLTTVYRSPQGLSSLFAGFNSALVSELAIGWLATELAHYLCKSAWPKLK